MRCWPAHQGKVRLAALLHSGQIHQEGDDALPAVLGRGVDLVDQEVVVLLVALAMVVVQHLCTMSARADCEAGTDEYMKYLSEDMMFTATTAQDVVWRKVNRRAGRSEAQCTQDEAPQPVSTATLALLYQANVLYKCTATYCIHCLMRNSTATQQATLLRGPRHGRGTWMPSPLMVGRCVTAEMRLSMSRSTGCSPSPKKVPVLVRTCQILRVVSAST